MVASLTPLLVIGVPVRATCLDGVDSLLSIVQMPRGVPVATVAINNSTNAALLAIRMLRISDTVLSQGCVSTRKTLDKRTWLKERNLSTKAGNHI
ncbi:unnamed protein product [Brassica oleracea]